MKIHFIGIGGIGVSALAQYYLEKGHEILGSDLAASEITKFLQEKGVKIFLGNSAENIDDSIDMVIHSPAVKSENPEYKKAKELKIKTQSYPEALGDLTKKYYTIAVSGSHGKSTTTAMIGLILIKAGLDPTVIVGTKLKEFGPDASEAGSAGSPVSGTNFRMGKSKYLVIEACEYDGSFLEYSPKIAVITNIDKEHMDYFKNFSNVKKAFKGFIMRLPKDGTLVFSKDDKNISAGKNAIGYSLGQKEAVKLGKILKIPGKHNVSNALAALTVARILGIKDSVSFKSLGEYRGSWRRFEIFEKKLTRPYTLKPIPFTLISDYGHHPTEILATLKATREKYPRKKIWCIFQPHQYQRTFYLFKDFIRLFKKVPVDDVIITDIYDVAGREEKAINKKINSEKMVKKVAKTNVAYMPIETAENFVKENIRSGQVLIIMGAGDIYKLVEKF